MLLNKKMPTLFRPRQIQKHVDNFKSEPDLKALQFQTSEEVFV